MSRDTTHRWPVMAILAGVTLTFSACGTSPGDHPGSAVAGPASNTRTSPAAASPEHLAPTTAGSAAGLRVGGVPFPMPPAGTCHVGTLNGQPLPDPHCTPGARNPAVTQDTIASTICRAGWTATVRPPVTVTDAIKAASARAYSIPPGTGGELDHDIPLELGGYPGTAGDVANLWFETGPIPNPKDQIENTLNHATCAGLIPLVVAQGAIARQWVTAVQDAGLALVGDRVCLRVDPARCTRR